MKKNTLKKNIKYKNKTRIKKYRKRKITYRSNKGFHFNNQTLKNLKIGGSVHNIPTMPIQRNTNTIPMHYLTGGENPSAQPETPISNEPINSTTTNKSDELSTDQLSTNEPEKISTDKPITDEPDESDNTSTNNSDESSTDQLSTNESDKPNELSTDEPITDESDNTPIDEPEKISTDELSTNKPDELPTNKPDELLTDEPTTDISEPIATPINNTHIVTDATPYDPENPLKYQDIPKVKDPNVDPIELHIEDSPKVDNPTNVDTDSIGETKAETEDYSTIANNLVDAINNQPETINMTNNESLNAYFQSLLSTFVEKIKKELANEVADKVASKIQLLQKSNSNELNQ
jgi:hypothetical protein